MLMLIGLFSVATVGADPENGGQPDMRCGSYSMYIALRSMDLIHEPFTEFEKRIGPPSLNGYSFGQLEEIGKHSSAHCVGVRTSLQNLQNRTGRFACLALIDKAHIVNLVSIDELEVFIIDAPRSYRVPIDTFTGQWDGTALLVSPSALAVEEELSAKGFDWRWIGAAGCVLVTLAVVSIAFARRRRAQKITQVICVLMLSLVGCSKIKEPTGPPRIVFGELEKDFGEVSIADHEFRASFPFQNQGFSDLRIIKVEKSCSCASVSTKTQDIPAGGSDELIALVKVLTPGTRSVSLLVHTNDPINQIVRLEARLKGTAPVQFEPDFLDLGSLLPGARIERDVRIAWHRPDSASNYLFESIDCDPRHQISATFAAEALPEIELKSSGTRGVKVVLQAGKELGNQSGFIELKVGNCSISSVRMPIRWRVKDLVEVAPTRLHLQTTGRNFASTGRIIVSSEPDTILELDEVTASTDTKDIDLDCKRLRGNLFAINVLWRHPRNPGHYQSSIAIRCRQPMERTIDVPISAYIAGAPGDLE